MPTITPAVDPWRAGVRDETLDMVKGLLVVGMLVIHAANLSLATPENRYLVYPTLLGFVSGSWLLISGYIIGLRYRPMFRADSRAVSMRLFGRGWRLVAIYVASNLALGNLSLPACFGSGNPARCDLVHVLVTGDDSQAFEVLLGIGYTLVAAPLVLVLPVRFVGWLTLIALVVLSAVQAALTLELPIMVWMMSCGISGIVIGSIVSPPVVQRVMEEQLSRGLAAMLAVLIWCGTDMLFVFGIAHYDTPALYVPHVAAMLWMLYGAGTWIATIEGLRRPLALLAHYSLLAYMGQMAVLRTWRWVAPDGLDSFPVLVLVGLVALLAGLTVLSLARNRFRWVNRLYLSVFG